MPTRRRQEDAPIAMERYMSSPVYSARRPIPANVVAEKAAGYPDPSDRRLLFFLQALSMQQGGLRAAAEDFEQRFPKAASAARELIGEDPVADFAAYLAGSDPRTPFEAPPPGGSAYHDLLLDLAINPDFDLGDFKICPAGAALWTALEEYRQHCIASQKSLYVTTSLGEEMAELFDQSAAFGGITVIESPAGSGKSCGAEGWYKTHPGEVYLITLSGITNRTNLMQKIGLELGFATCQRKASELQAKIEAFVQRTKAMLVIDEAHFLWPQSKRISSNPELIDWIDTLVNMGARVVLICTDQFARQRERVEKQTAWTSAQFKRRVRENRKLAGKPSLSDAKLVARHLLCFGWNQKAEKWMPDLTAIRRVEVLQLLTDLVAGAAMATDLPLTTVDNVVAKARYHARRSGKSAVALADIEFARQSCEASDLIHLGSAASSSQRKAASQPTNESFSATQQIPSVKQQMSRNSPALPTNPAFRRARATDLASA